ncbi:MAG: preprotein translocase subunit SecG [Planctomycetes bacterium]|nr:preprotein translocase subunit SecG [Planctomycetota bacterium]
MLYGFLIFLLVMDCLLLILLVLVQSGSGSGLASAFGGGVEDSLLGSKGNVTLNRWTSGLAAGFFILCCLLAWVSPGTTRSVTSDMDAAETSKDAGSTQGSATETHQNTPGPVEQNETQAPGDPSASPASGSEAGTPADGKTGGASEGKPAASPIPEAGPSGPRNGEDALREKTQETREAGTETPEPDAKASEPAPGEKNPSESQGVTEDQPGGAQPGEPGTEKPSDPE